MKHKSRCLFSMLLLLVLVFPLWIHAAVVAEESTEVAYQIAVNPEKLDLKVGASKQLKATSAPRLAKGDKLVWRSSDDAVATVSKAGQVKAVGAGTCTITAELQGNEQVLGSCLVKVTQWITSITPVAKAVNVRIGTPVALQYSIKPSNATNKTLAWTSSDNGIARVDAVGTVHGIGAGKCTITATSNDGSKKKAVFNITVLCLSSEKSEYHITSKATIKIPITFHGEEVSYTYTSSNFDVTWADQWRGDVIDLIVDPLRTGTGQITVFDTAYKPSAVKLTITVGQGAVYDEKGFPRMDFKGVSRFPERYAGDPVHIKGKVLQVMRGSSEVSLRVATRGGYQDVVYVIIPSTVKTMGKVLEDDQVTIYGRFDDLYSYTTIMGAEVTLPSLTAEKVIIR